MATATTTTGLNLRSGPDTRNAVLLVIPADAQVTITGPERNDWYPVTYGATPAWAMARYVRRRKPEDAMTDEKECDCPVYPTCGCPACETCTEEASNAPEPTV